MWNCWLDRLSASRHIRNVPVRKMLCIFRVIPGLKTGDFLLCPFTPQIKIKIKLFLVSLL